MVAKVLQQRMAHQIGRGAGQLLALQFDRTKSQHSLSAESLLFVVPHDLFVPLPLFRGDVFEVAPADWHRQANACIAFLEVKPGDRQSLSAAQWV